MPTEDTIALVLTALRHIHRDLFANAADLLSEDGENPEYDRGVAELVTAQIGIPLDYKFDVLDFLRVVKR